MDSLGTVRGTGDQRQCPRAGRFPSLVDRECQRDGESWPGCAPPNHSPWRFARPQVIGDYLTVPQLDDREPRES